MSTRSTSGRALYGRAAPVADRDVDSMTGRAVAQRPAEQKSRRADDDRGARSIEGETAKAEHVDNILVTGDSRNFFSN